MHRPCSISPRPSAFGVTATGRWPLRSLATLSPTAAFLHFVQSNAHLCELRYTQSSVVYSKRRFCLRKQLHKPTHHAETNRSSSRSGALDKADAAVATVDNSVVECSVHSLSPPFIVCAVLKKRGTIKQKLCHERGQIRLEARQFGRVQVILPAGADGSMVGHIIHREAVAGHDWQKVVSHARHLVLP